MSALLPIVSYLPTRLVFPDARRPAHYVHCRFSFKGVDYICTKPMNSRLVKRIEGIKINKHGTFIIYNRLFKSESKSRALATEVIPLDELLI